MEIPITLGKYIYNVLTSSTHYPSNVTVALQEEYSVDYGNLSYMVKGWVDELDIYDNSTLGTMDSNLTMEFSIYTPDFFIANVNTTPEYLLCYSDDHQHITDTVWLQNFEV
jgi:hypothetical protein